MAKSFHPKYRIVHQTKTNIWKNSKIFKNFKKKKWNSILPSLALRKKYKRIAFNSFIYGGSFNYYRFKKRFLWLKYKKLNYIKLFRRNRDFKLNFFKSNYFREDSIKYVNLPLFNRTNLSRKFFLEALLHRQKLRKSLGKVSKKQFKKLFKLSQKRKREKTFSFLKLINRRFDCIIANTFFSLSIFQARQEILHGFFEINGKIETNPNFILNEGDIISVSKKKWAFVAYRVYYSFLTKNRNIFRTLFLPNVEICYSTLQIIILLDKNGKLNVISKNSLESNPFFS